MNKIIIYIQNIISRLFLSKPRRLKLREWAEVESIKKQIYIYAERGGYVPIPELIIKILSIYGIKRNFNKISWMETMYLFQLGQEINSPKTIPILKAKGSDENIPWDYADREWKWWVHLFASNYGWDEGQIEKLDIDTAVGLFQEMRVSEQLEKEWQYGLSELAYEYIPSTKKSKFRPMPRPSWMLVTKENYRPKLPPKIKIPQSMMPVGIIVNLDKEDANETT